MNFLKRILLAAALFITSASVIHAQAPDPAPTGSGILLGSGIGFKPYQTTIKSGSSAFLEGGLPLTSGKGFYGFGRVELRPTDAQLIVEGCKSLTGKDSNALILICGGPGFGANADNLGLSLAAGGKLFYKITRFTKSDNTWVEFSVNVDKTTVPAPVTVDGITTSPVQPNFRFGIFKVF